MYRKVRNIKILIKTNTQLVSEFHIKIKSSELRYRNSSLKESTMMTDAT